jgi:hypothetical protein
METVDLSTRIDTTERNSAVFVDKFDDGEVWLSIQVACGRAHCTLTTEQAKEMIAALTRIVEAA